MRGLGSTQANVEALLTSKDYPSRNTNLVYKTTRTEEVSDKKERMPEIARPSMTGQVTSPLPRVTIQFCTQCKWMLRAAYVWTILPSQLMEKLPGSKLSHEQPLT